jgi:hypothetical protein
MEENIFGMRRDRSRWEKFWFNKYGLFPVFVLSDKSESRPYYYLSNNLDVTPTFRPVGTFRPIGQF